MGRRLKPKVDNSHLLVVKSDAAHIQPVAGFYRSLIIEVLLFSTLIEISVIPLLTAWVTSFTNSFWSFAIEL